MASTARRFGLVRPRIIASGSWLSQMRKLELQLLTVFKQRDLSILLKATAE